jgi:hypothetical protein
MALNLSRNTKVFVSSVNGASAAGGIHKAHITTAGVGYAVGNVITFAAPAAGGTTAKAIVLSLSGTGVATIGIPNNFRGSGYVDGEDPAEVSVTNSLTNNTAVSTDPSTPMELEIDTVTTASTTIDGARTGTGLFKGNEKDANCFRMGVLDGYSFSQGSESTDVMITEAGASPSRGSKRFNDSLPPVEWSFGTYVRPFTHGAASIRTDNDHDMVENLMWSAIAGKTLTDATSPASGEEPAVVCNSTDADVSFARSDFHELMKLNIFFALENTTYRLNDAQVNTAEIDFSIDGIAQITWSGNATTIDQVTDLSGEDPSEYLIFTDTAAEETAGNSATYAETINYVDVTGPSDADYLRNKLSTMTLSHTRNSSNVLEVGAADETAVYVINITGGSITIENNITYVTPETLGVVDKPIGSFTGSRSITGSLTMYLNTSAGVVGALASNDLLTDLAAATSLVTNEFNMSLFMGGASAPYVEFDIPKAHLSIPTIEVGDLISTSVEFMAHGDNLLTGNEMAIKYFGSTEHSQTGYHETTSQAV